MPDKDTAGHAAPETESDDFARRIYDKLERDERVSYERMKIQDEIRQTVLSWGVAALAAMGAFLSGAAYLSYDRIIVSIAESIEGSLDEKVQAALDSKLDEANRKMETVFRRADEALSREVEEVRDDRKQVEATVIEARSAMASLEAQIDFVRGAAVKASDAAVEATRAADSSQARVGKIDEQVTVIRDGLEQRTQQFETALNRASDIQDSIRDAIKKLNDERVSLSAEIARYERRLAVVEARLASLDGGLDSAAVSELQDEEARLEALQALKIVFYVSRWNDGADIRTVIGLHDALVAKGVPNDPYATEDNASFTTVAAEIDGDFTGVRKHLKGDAFQLFASPSREREARILIEMLAAIDSSVTIEPVFDTFVIADDKFRQIARDGLAAPENVVLITKTPPAVF